MLKEGQIKVLARLTAVERLMTHVLWILHRDEDDPLQALRDYRVRLSLELRSATIQGFDAAMSDLLAQELEEAADRLVGSLIERLERESDLPPGPTP